MPVIPEIRIAPTVQEVAQDAAALIASVSQHAIQAKGRFLMVLSGGSTPKAFYQTLASPEWKTRFDWSRIWFLFGDERCVPPAHPESNYGMVQATLFQPLNIPANHIYRMKGELEDQAAAAQEYEAKIRSLTQCAAPDLPRLDLVLLGLGNDGHTASLFPGTMALQEQDKVVTVGQAPTGIRTRLTLTLGVLNHAAVVLFLVTGASKAEMVRRVLQAESDVDRAVPAARVSPNAGRLVWMLDQPAGQLLKPRSSHKGIA